MPTAAGTAWQALFEAGGLHAGQTVFIHAGLGGVGSFAVQLAKLAGAHVITTTSAGGIALAKSLGADEVINYQAQDLRHLTRKSICCWIRWGVKPRPVPSASCGRAGRCRYRLSTRSGPCSRPRGQGSQGGTQYKWGEAGATGLSC